MILIFTSFPAEHTCCSLLIHKHGTDREVAYGGIFIYIYNNIYIYNPEFKILTSSKTQNDKIHQKQINLKTVIFLFLARTFFWVNFITMINLVFTHWTIVHNIGIQKTFNRVFLGHHKHIAETLNTTSSMYCTLYIVQYNVHTYGCTYSRDSKYKQFYVMYISVYEYI